MPLINHHVDYSLLIVDFINILGVNHDDSSLDPIYLFTEYLLDTTEESWNKFNGYWHDMDIETRNFIGPMLEQASAHFIYINGNLDRGNCHNQCVQLVKNNVETILNNHLITDLSKIIISYIW